METASFGKQMLQKVGYLTRMLSDVLTHTLIIILKSILNQMKKTRVQRINLIKGTESQADLDRLRTIITFKLSNLALNNITKAFKRTKYYSQVNNQINF